MSKRKGGGGGNEGTAAALPHAAPEIDLEAAEAVSQRERKPLCLLPAVSNQRRASEGSSADMREAREHVKLVFVSEPSGSRFNSMGTIRDSWAYFI